MLTHHQFQQLSNLDGVSIEHQGRMLEYKFDGVPILYSAEDSFDTCLYKMPSKVWTILGVKELSVGPPVTHGGVIIYGFDTSGSFVNSMGTISPHTNLFHLKHTASTRSSFSGSPLLNAKSQVVGLHCGCEVASQNNLAVQLFWNLIGRESDVEFGRHWRLTKDLNEYDRDFYAVRQGKADIYHNSGRIFSVESIEVPEISSWADEMDYVDSQIHSQLEVLKRQAGKVVMRESGEVLTDVPMPIPTAINAEALNSTAGEKSLFRSCAQQENTNGSENKQEKELEEISKKQDDAPSRGKRRRRRNRVTWQKQLPMDGVERQSGFDPKEGLNVSLLPSGSTPIALDPFQVLAVSFTKKQLKAYNRITHSRLFHAYLRTHSPHENFVLQRCVLYWSLSFGTKSKEIPHPDVLLAFSEQAMRLF